MRFSLATLACSLFFALTPSCVLVAETGARVELTLRVAPGEATSADGVSVALAEGALSLIDVRLRACEERAEMSFTLGIPVARALHPGDRSDHLGAPQVVSLNEPEQVLGRLSPDAGRYCALEVFVGPSAELDDWTLRAEGAADGGSFDARGFAMGIWTLSLPEALILDEATPEATLTIALDLAEAIRATNVGGRNGEELGLDLILALEASARAERRELPE